MNSGMDILAQGVITDNLILLQGLGLYALTRYTKDTVTAAKAGLAMVLTMTTAAVLIWTLEPYVSNVYALNLPWVMLVAVLSVLTWQKLLGGSQWLPGFDDSLASGLLNSALVGLLLGAGHQTSGVTTVGFGVSAGIGYALVLIIMGAIRERLDMAPVPRPLRGVPIVLITAGLLALGLMGFRL